MKGEAQSFNWLKDKIFEIPFFQRPYVWKEDNWDELWNSIVSNPLNEMPFIGSFILQVKDTKGQIKYTVIDGQQRLTTLSILIKSFLDSSADLKNDEKYIDAINEIESYIKYKEVKAMETKKIPRIIPSSVDKKDFINVMELTNPNDNFEKTHNILRCYQFFMNKFSKCNKDQRLSIGTKFRSDIKFFIAIELDPKDDEQKIFDSVNRLGMKLLNSDIIKNNLYQRLKEISPDDFDVNDFYQKNWIDIYQVNIPFSQTYVSTPQMLQHHQALKKVLQRQPNFHICQEGSIRPFDPHEYTDNLGQKLYRHTSYHQKKTL